MFNILMLIVKRELTTDYEKKIKEKNTEICLPFL